MALTEAEWQNRRKYIGGSDARTVLQGDAADWKALRDEKVDGTRKEVSEATQLLFDVGSAIEPLILREFNKKVPLAKNPGHLVWRADPILAFTPDGITGERREVVQCKFHSGDQDIFKLAESYKAQLTHEMICSHTNRIWLAVIFGHYTRFQHMEVRRDEALVEQYLMKAMEFKAYWQTGVLPESMVGEIADLTIERKRDHVWEVGDNFVSAHCMDIMDNMAQATVFNDALESMKALIKTKAYADCASLTWKNAEGFGVRFRVNARGAVSVALAFPPRPKMKAAERAARAKAAGIRP